MIRATAIVPQHQSATAEDNLRLAAIDVGSNSVHMVVAQADADGGLTTLWRMKEMVGLGRISFPSRRLSREAMDRALGTLGRFVQEARHRQAEKVLAVATSAIREAENGGRFIERVRRELGLHLRVVSAKDEARLIYLGVRHAVSLGTTPSLILDIGGGSVEFVVARKDHPLLLESRKLGAARMTARFIKSDVAQVSEIKALLSHYDAELRPLIASIRSFKPARIIGTSGTLENLAAMCGRGDEEPPVIRRGPFCKMLDQLLETSSDQRSRIRGLDDQRRDQVLAGAILVNELFRRLDIEEIEICRSAMREGLLVDYLAHHRPELQVRRRIPEPRRRAVLDLARRCHWQQAHCEQVARLALRLFDQLRPLHGLEKEDRELIEYGALLHDIGALIGPRRHHKHSMYLVLHGELGPFSAREVKIIANIARFHRKARPSKKHASYASLSRSGRRTVRIGAALLRVADGLDRTNCAVVTNLRCRIRRRRVELIVKARGDAELEIWSALARSGLFERVLGRKLSITQKPA